MLFKKMAALAFNILSLIKRGELLDRHYTFKHAFDLPFPKNLHVYLDENYLKKFDEVFIIGDIHGCYDELMKLLKDANALKDSTLKIFAGDLVRKGPKNKEVLDLIQNSESMLAVRGNHDEVALREYINAKNPDYQLSEEDIWLKMLSPENVEYLMQLPYTITLKPLNSVVVHAGLVPGEQFENNNPYNMVTMRNIILHDYFWEGGMEASKHDSKGYPWASQWPGPLHVYFGHDAKRMLQRYPHATGLDTGCVYGNRLTGVFINGIRKGTFVAVNALKHHRIPKQNRMRNRKTEQEEK